MGDDGHVGSADRAEVEANRELIRSARKRGKLALLGAFTKLSGPGWLQSAITLGGGSLASSLYLGVLAGTSLLWLQPLAMILGLIMLSAIAYVTLSTGERPLRAINKHVNPVLGWGWVLATLMANLVWALPQFSLATAATRQNLLPHLVGDAVMPEVWGNLIVCLSIAAICVAVVWFYDSGRTGVKIFHILLKLMVALIVVAFVGVLVKRSFSAEGLQWGAIFSGLIPDLSMLSSPSKEFAPHIQAVAPAFRDFWTSMIVSQQRDVMIAAAATAVGINMTFLLPYSMLRRGWGKDFRGMAMFDLGTGLFIPFILVTGCVVIVAGAQFHTQPAPGLLGETDAQGELVKPNPSLLRKYNDLAAVRVKEELGADAFAAIEKDKAALAKAAAALPEADKRMAAMLVKRDAFNLAESLSPLTGDVFGHYVFGVGVVGMAVSSIIILMLINGFVVCEMLDVPSRGWAHRLGCLAPLVGILGPFIWAGKAKFWLAVPTSNFAFVLLPIAYFAFLFLMNQKKLLGDAMPRGGKRIVWNTLMGLAAGILGLACIWQMWNKIGWYGIGLLAAFIALALVVHVARRRRPRA